MDENSLSAEIIGGAIEVHRCLGPGLLESVYEAALARELTMRSIPFEGQVGVPVWYKGVELGTSLRIDLLVADLVVVEVKSVDRLSPVHEAQLLTYLRLANKKLGLLLNFNSVVLRDGIKRIVNRL